MRADLDTLLIAVYCAACTLFPSPPEPKRRRGRPQKITDNELICLTRNEGKVRWMRVLPSYQNEKKRKDPISWAGPVLGGDRLIVLASDGGALSLSPYTGEPLGRQEISAGGYFSPVIADNSLYVLTDDARLSAYR